MAIFRRRKGASGRRLQSDDKKEKVAKESEEKPDSKFNSHTSSPLPPPARLKRNCVDSCCWFVGCICSMWWFLLFLYNVMPQYVTEAITGPLPDPPGLKLAKDGLQAKHPVVFVPGIVTGGLELWDGHSCADGLFRKRLWGGTFGEVYRRYP